MSKKKNIGEQFQFFEAKLVTYYNTKTVFVDPYLDPTVASSTVPFRADGSGIIFPDPAPEPEQFYTSAVRFVVH